MNARIVALHVRPVREAAPQPREKVGGRVGGGIEGDFHVAKAARSVLVVDRSTLDDLGLAPGALREQVTVEGMPTVTALEPGTRLRMGGLTLQVNGPCDPCLHIGELNGVEDREAFRLSLAGRRGATCTVVVASGSVSVRDAVEVIAPVQA